MLTTILLIIVGLIVVVLILAATKPDSFTVTRSTTINAPAEKIFPLINDFHRWPAWSPWESIEPSMSRTHSGAPSGKGAAYAWEGKKVGTGRMEIIDTTPPSKIVIKLDFLKPWEAHNTTIYTLQSSGGPTNVTWSMNGQNNFMSKVMQVFMTMDKMVGKDFEKGLANMKSVAESGQG